MNANASFLMLITAVAFVQSPATFAAEDKAAGEFPYKVSFELGEAEFAPGDSITIQSVRGTMSTITTGQTYCVTGTYTLASQPEAELALFVTATNPNAGRTSIDPRQVMKVQKGGGIFRVVQTINEPGYPHISFYPLSGGSCFGGVYFGQGSGVLRHKGWSYFDQPAGAPKAIDNNESSVGSLASQNRRILEYLGSPVAAPANLEVAYSKEGIESAMRQAAQKAGAELKQIQIDDSEFPFLVGLVFAEGDYPKIAAQIKRMPAYEEQGGVSSKTSCAINVIPWRAFPSESAERIGRRMTVRERMLYDQLSRHH